MTPLARAAVCAALSFAISGCGAAIESTRVQRRFETVFHCPNAAVTREPGGYLAEGCGRVAHFACIETPNDTDDDDDEHVKPGGGRILGAMLGAMLTGIVRESMEVDTCVLEHSESIASAPPEPVIPPVNSERKTPEGPVVRARVLFQGGYLALLGKPARHPEHVLIKVHSVQRFDKAPCEAELYQDGVELVVQEALRADDFNVQLVVRAEALRDMDRTIRFAGEVCGLDVELDDPGRQAIGLFEARFREERARLPKSQTALASTTPTPAKAEPSSGADVPVAHQP